MRYIKYILLFIFSITFLNVYADTCSYKEQTILNNDFSNVKVTYEIVNENNINILIYNITENLYISYKDADTEENIDINYSNTNNGKYTITKDASNVEEYSFEIRSNISACFGNILTTKKIIKPAYNDFSSLNICNEKGLENHSYCQEFITSEITKSESEVIKTLQDFLSAKVDKITTTKQIEEESYDIQKIISFSVVGVVIIGIVIAILLIKKKRSEL